MKFSVSRFFYLGILVLGFMLAVPSLSQRQYGAVAQNSVSGYVYGTNRQKMADLYVELQDDYGRTIQRVQTTGSGYYEFHGFGSGFFTVKVLALGTDYEEQEQRIEFVNTLVEKPEGGYRLGGFDDQQLDIYLKLKPGATPANAVLFFQEIPPEAQKLYEKAVADLDAKRNADGLEGLRQAIEKFPKYYYALERLGTEYIRLGKPEGFKAAELLLAAAVEVNPRGFKSWYGLAYARYSLGDMAGSMAAVQKAIEINPGSPDALLLSGSLLRQSKKYQDAEKQLLKARDLAKETLPQIHWELALLYGNDMKRYGDAAKELKLFIKANPGAKDVENIKKLIADFEAKAQKT
jgi:tetratricopeptide (TPR) repeat protein